MLATGIGFRAKTGRAIAVALTLDGATPLYLSRWEISLIDNAFPATGQPHHHLMEMPWPEALETVKALETRVERVAFKALSGILEELKSKDARVKGVGVVGSPDRDLERIGNRHMRAHAAEGILFRRVLEVAARQHEIRCRSLSDRNIKEVAAIELDQSPDSFLTLIGRLAGKPWRADERAAALAAWLMLGLPSRVTSKL